MILLQLLRNQLYLNVLLLSAADADIGNGGDLLKLRNDLVVYIVVKVGLCLVIDRQGHGIHLVNIHLHDNRGIAVVREISLQGIHLLL